EYTTLNDDFKKRLENENRHQDEKKIGEKRPILESPSKGSDTDFSEERRGRDQAISFTLWDETDSIKDVEEIEEKEDKDVITEASPSKKKSGTKKKKGGGKKKK
ncbi:hypothetical protein RhiirA5_443164, partial [Rhizophagus irregularis]